MPNTKKGFTLVEMLIAIAILGVLITATVTMINIPKQMQKSRDVVRKEEISILAGALERYYADNNVYPTSASYQPMTSIAVLVPDYIKQIPVGPNGDTYQYIAFNGNQDFCICAAMENESNTTSCTPPSGYTYCIENTF